VEHLDVLEAGPQRRKGVDVALHLGVLAGQAAATVLVVPQVGGADLLLEIGQPAAQALEPEVALGLVEPLGQRGDVVCEVAHREGQATGHGWTDSSAGRVPVGVRTGEGAAQLPDPTSRASRAGRC